MIFFMLYDCMHLNEKFQVQNSVMMNTCLVCTLSHFWKSNLYDHLKHSRKKTHIKTNLIVRSFIFFLTGNTNYMYYRHNFGVQSTRINDLLLFTQAS